MGRNSRSPRDGAALRKDVRTGSRRTYKCVGPTIARAGQRGCAVRVLYRLLGRFRTEYVGFVIVAATLAGFEGIVHPLLIKSIFDQGVLRSNFKRFVLLVLAYLSLGIIINVISVATALWSKSLENRILKTMTRRMLEAYYEAQYSSVLAKGQGYFINRVYGDLREGLLPLLQLLESTISQVVLLASSCLVLIYLSWQGFLMLAAIIPISAGIGTLLRRRLRILTTQEREQDGTVLAILSKALGAFRMIKGFHLFSHTADALDHWLAKYFSTVYQRYRVSRLFQGLNDCTMVISDFLSLFVGALFVLRGALSFGAYLAFINTFWRTVTALTQLFSRMADFHSLGVMVERIASFLSPSSALYFRTGLSASITNLTFSYDGRPILRDFSLKTSPGDKILIVGPNGSGKTTLANILSGYLSPSQGDVVLPEKISSVTLPISFPPLKVEELPVDDYLLSTLGLQRQTVLEAYPDELSAGQQQKLAISLALSQDADLYIIDEPLACLDEESKNLVINLLFDRTKGKTLIVIMHGSQEHHYLFDRVINLSTVRDLAETRNL